MIDHIDFDKKIIAVDAVEYAFTVNAMTDSELAIDVCHDSQHFSEAIRMAYSCADVITAKFNGQQQQAMITRVTFTMGMDDITHHIILKPLAVNHGR